MHPPDKPHGDVDPSSLIAEIYERAGRKKFEWVLSKVLPTTPEPLRPAFHEFMDALKNRATELRKQPAPDARTLAEFKECHTTLDSIEQLGFVGGVMKEVQVDDDFLIEGEESANDIPDCCLGKVWPVLRWILAQPTLDTLQWHQRALALASRYSTDPSDTIGVLEPYLDPESPIKQLLKNLLEETTKASDAPRWWLRACELHLLYLHHHAAIVLGAFAPPTPQLIRALIDCLKRGQTYVSFSAELNECWSPHLAAMALARYGKKASAALPTLADAAVGTLGILSLACLRAFEIISNDPGEVRKLKDKMEWETTWRWNRLRTVWEWFRPMADLRSLDDMIIFGPRKASRIRR